MKAPPFFRIALLIKNVEEGMTTREDMKTLEMLVNFTDLEWEMLVVTAAFTRTHLEGCVEIEEITCPNT